MMTVAHAADAELVSFRRSHGGAGDDLTLDIYVDSNGIYTVGRTSSFGPDAPNGFLTIFNSDNSHRCSVSFNVGAGSSDEAVALAVHGGLIYVLGNTNFGPNPPNHFIAVFNTSCNLQSFRLFDLGVDEGVADIAVEPSATPYLYVVGYQKVSGAYVAKIDTSLNVVWSKFFRVRGGNDVANAVAFSAGRVHVAGDSDDGSSLNMFMSVFDTAGSHIATREVGGATNEQAFDILVSGGSIYLTGYTDYAGRLQEVILAKLDSSYSVSWIKAFGSSTGNERGYAAAAAGGLVYVVGQTNLLGSVDVLMTAFAGDGSLSHSFAIVGGGGDDVANSASSLGSCVYPAGQHSSLPLIYVVFDGEVNAVSMSVNTLTPTTATATPTTISASPAVGSFTPQIDTPGGLNSFYSRFCPDTIVSTTTSTTTSTVGTTVTTTSTSTTTTTAYAIATTTFTQTSSVIVVVSQTSVTTISTTTTQTLSTTATRTTTETFSTTSTTVSTEVRTSTQSTTQTLTAVTTVAFPEPFSTFVLPILVVLVVAVAATALVTRRRAPEPPPSPF